MRADSNSAQLQPSLTGFLRRVFFQDFGGMKPVLVSQKASSSSVQSSTALRIYCANVRTGCNLRDEGRTRSTRR